MSERTWAIARLRYLAKSLLKEIEWLPADLRFKYRHRFDRMPAIPGPTLRHRVAGDYGIDWFHSSGLETRTAFERALATTEKAPRDFTSILDFGAGCGRVLRWLGEWGEGRELHGVDIDFPAVWWCRR